MEDMVKILLEMKEEIGELKGIQMQTLEQTKRTNGRVTALECKVVDLETAAARNDGAKSVDKSMKDKAWSISEKIVVLLIGVLAGRFGK